MLFYDKMKLWKENKISQEWELSNQEIAKQFLKSRYYDFPNRSIDMSLVNFISSKDGLNSSWDWDSKKGSIDGSKDMIEILDIIHNLKEKKN